MEANKTWKYGGTKNDDVDWLMLIKNPGFFGRIWFKEIMETWKAPPSTALAPASLLVPAITPSRTKDSQKNVSQHTLWERNDSLKCKAQKSLVWRTGFVNWLTSSVQAIDISVFLILSGVAAIQRWLRMECSRDYAILRLIFIHRKHRQIPKRLKKSICEFLMSIKYRTYGRWVNIDEKKNAILPRPKRVGWIFGQARLRLTFPTTTPLLYLPASQGMSESPGWPALQWSRCRYGPYWGSVSERCSAPPPKKE